MKVGLIIHRLISKGGTQRQVLSLAQELKKKGHSVKVYAFECDPAGTYTDLIDGLEILTPENYEPKKVEPFWGFFKRPSYLSWWHKRNRTARSLAHMIDRDTEILNPHGFYVYAVSAYFKKEVKNIPCVWSLNTMTLRSWKYWRYKELDPDFHISFAKRLFHHIMDGIEIQKFIRHHEIVVLNNQNKEYVKQYMGKDAFVVRIGTDAAKFSFKERVPPRNKSARLLCVGSFFEQRRFEDAVLAVKILVKEKGYNIFLSFVGDYMQHPLYFQKVKSLVDMCGLGERIKFLGVVSEEDLRKNYYESDMGLFPSHLSPGNAATFEMMACGAPTIVSRSASTSELLLHEENVLLVNPQMPSELAGAVIRLIDNPELYTKISKNGRKFIEEKMGWASYAQMMEDIFLKIAVEI